MANWQYDQKTGYLTHYGVLVGKGYSGKGEGKNNPAMQDVHNVGPIPRGVWMMGDVFDSEKHGVHCIPLTPAEETETFGRSGFLCHGDSLQHPGEASEGCIVQPITARIRLFASPDRQLEVV